MTNSPNKYAEFISNQLIKEGVATSPQNRNATLLKRHADLSKRSPDLKMDGVDGYFHKDNNMSDQSFIIKHPSGNISHTVIDEKDSTEKDYEAASRRDNPHLNDDEHKQVAKAIDKNT